MFASANAQNLKNIQAEISRWNTEGHPQYPADPPQTDSKLNALVFVC